MNKKYQYGTETICIICNKKFTPRDKGSNQKCCSHACRGALQSKKATIHCAICKKSFIPKRPDYKTCSRICGTAYRMSRKKFDPMVEVRQKLALFCCGSIHRCIKNKTDRTYSLLGYNSEELRKHLERHFEEGMSWDNYGNGLEGWSIDHTRPISSFPVTATVAQINALDNLRPMWHRKNCSKGKKWEGQ